MPELLHSICGFPSFHEFCVPEPDLSPDIAFLIKCGFSAEELVRLERAATALGVYPHQYLLLNNHIREDVYYKNLAQAYDLRFFGNVPDSFTLPRKLSIPEAGFACRAGLVLVKRGEQTFYLAASSDRELMQLIRHLVASPGLKQKFLLTTPSAFRDFLLMRNPDPVLQHSITLLQRMRPNDSARRSFKPFLAASLLALVFIVLSVSYGTSLFAPLFGALGALLYLQACLLRIFAFSDNYTRQDTMPPSLSDRQLPICSILVPLYKEAHIAPQLIESLRAINYPRAKLDILILIEENDHATAQALRMLDMPPEFRIISAPYGEPRTKPRALQLGLSFARGEIITIFDAEDVPHEQQLRRAAACLHAGGSNLACVQAQLRIDNGDKSWLARQFALEYAALFTIFLPSMTQRNFPVLLGGTSNYFKADILHRIGGWDPWNVTEDADLGVRLARAGYQTTVIELPTEEEAPVTLRNWFNQRMRWQKGWMQTFIVHFSQIGALRKELGVQKTCVLAATLGVSLVSALAYPFMLLWLVRGLALDVRMLMPGALGPTVFGLCAAAFIGGHILPCLHIYAGAKRTGQKLTLPLFATIWFYWLLISAAAYGALIGLLRSPHYWSKTEHLGRQSVGMARRLRILLAEKARLSSTGPVTAQVRINRPYRLLANTGRHIAVDPAFNARLRRNIRFNMRNIWQSRTSKGA